MLFLSARSCKKEGSTLEFTFFSLRPRLLVKGVPSRIQRPPRGFQLYALMVGQKLKGDPLKLQGCSGTHWLQLFHTGLGTPLAICPYSAYLPWLHICLEGLEISKERKWRALYTGFMYSTQIYQT